MYRKRPDLDIVKDLLELVLETNPSNEFTRSLLYQYEERGGLSKKQLEGLYKKASKISIIPPAKLATLEAMILKRPNRYKSALPENAPLYTKDTKTGELISAILEKYPHHKRVLFFRAKYDNNEIFTAVELAELERFHKLLNR
ncbi:MAG TPA: hypothetical protein PLV32_01800 [Chitinophagaceae bacterium]|nr:hypothetical protein [Chitinophagaceae bacterium]